MKLNLGWGNFIPDFPSEHHQNRQIFLHSRLWRSRKRYVYPLSMRRAKTQEFVCPCDWRNLIKRWSPQHVCFFQCRAPANQVFVQKYKFHKNVTLFLTIPAESRIQLLGNKYFIYDTVKKSITEVAQFFFARACDARLEAQYILIFPMGGATMQVFTSP